MKTVPKKHDYPWGYEIEWGKALHSSGKILHIHKQKAYKWEYSDTRNETLHCLFGSVFVITYDGEDKLWPGESYSLNSNVKEIRAGVEDAEVLFLSELI